jgi:hypothetical protein
MVGKAQHFKEGWRISALAESDLTIKVNMLGKILSPQDNIVEAAETIFVCPVLSRYVASRGVWCLCNRL